MPPKKRGDKSPDQPLVAPQPSRGAGGLPPFEALGKEHFKAMAAANARMPAIRNTLVRNATREHLELRALPGYRCRGKVSAVMQRYAMKQADVAEILPKPLRRYQLPPGAGVVHAEENGVGDASSNGQQRQQGVVDDMLPTLDLSLFTDAPNLERYGQREPHAAAAAAAAAEAKTKRLLALVARQAAHSGLPEIAQSTVVDYVHSHQPRILGFLRKLHRARVSAAARREVQARFGNVEAHEHRYPADVDFASRSPAVFPNDGNAQSRLIRAAHGAPSFERPSATHTTTTELALLAAPSQLAVGPQQGGAMGTGLSQLEAHLPGFGSTMTSAVVATTDDATGNPNPKPTHRRQRRFTVHSATGLELPSGALRDGSSDGGGGGAGFSEELPVDSSVVDPSIEGAATERGRQGPVSTPRAPPDLRALRAAERDAGLTVHERRGLRALDPRPTLLPMLEPTIDAATLANGGISALGAGAWGSSLGGGAPPRSPVPQRTPRAVPTPATLRNYLIPDPTLKPPHASVHFRARHGSMDAGGSSASPSAQPSARRAHDLPPNVQARPDTADSGHIPELEATVVPGARPNTTAKQLPKLVDDFSETSSPQGARHQNDSSAQQQQESSSPPPASGQPSSTGVPIAYGYLPVFDLTISAIAILLNDDAALLYAMSRILDDVTGPLAPVPFTDGVERTFRAAMEARPLAGPRIECGTRCFDVERKRQDAMVSPVPLLPQDELDLVRAAQQRENARLAMEGFGLDRPSSVTGGRGAAPQGDPSVVTPASLLMRQAPSPRPALAAKAQARIAVPGDAAAAEADEEEEQELLSHAPPGLVGEVLQGIPLSELRDHVVLFDDDEHTDEGWANRLMHAAIHAVPVGGHIELDPNCVICHAHLETAEHARRHAAMRRALAAGRSSTPTSVDGGEGANERPEDRVELLGLDVDADTEAARRKWHALHTSSRITANMKLRDLLSRRKELKSHVLSSPAHVNDVMSRAMKRGFAWKLSHRGQVAREPDLHAMLAPQLTPPPQGEEEEEDVLGAIPPAKTPEPSSKSGAGKTGVGSTTSTRAHSSLGGHPTTALPELFSGNKKKSHHATVDEAEQPVGGGGGAVVVVSPRNRWVASRKSGAEMAGQALWSGPSAAMQHEVERVQRCDRFWRRVTIFARSVGMPSTTEHATALQKLRDVLLRVRRLSSLLLFRWMVACGPQLLDARDLVRLQGFVAVELNVPIAAVAAWRRTTRRRLEGWHASHD